MENESKEKLNAEFFSSYKNLLTDYIEERMELAQLSAVEKTAILTAKLSFAAMVLAFGLFALFFINILFALFLGDLLNSRTLGFLIIVCFYLVLILLTFMLRKKIEGPIMNMVVKQIMSKTKHS
jgi:uncharacterized membrane protein YqjE